MAASLNANSLNYAETKAALERLIGRRVTISVVPHSTGGTVASVGVGYLQPAGEGGEPPGFDEVTTYALTEEREPDRNPALLPAVSIHDRPDFEGWDFGSRVSCVFSGLRVSVELADAEEWLAAERDKGGSPT